MADLAIEFENRAAGVRLSGTLALPGEAGPFPAVILVHGQGPLDRDMTFGHLKPFRAVAERLAAGGIATLRYDKRGVGESGGEFGSATREDLAGDVVAALEFLEHHEAILPGRIGLLGQSEGGLIAPLVAAGRDDVAFVVMLAGPAVSGRENLALSFAMFAQASPSNDRGVDELRRQVDRLLDLIAVEPPRPEARAAALELAESLVPHVINERTNVVLGGSDVTAEQFLGMLSSPCLQETVESEPEPHLGRVTCPVLALFAGRDKHVPARENAAALERSLEAAGNTHYTVETIADCNHLFQRCETGYPDEYFTIDHDISPEVLDRVAGWIGEQVRVGRR